MANEKNSEKAFLIPFLILKDIFYFFYKGVKFIFIDLIASLFNRTSAGVDQAYKNTKGFVDAENKRRQERIEKQKERKAKRQEKYNNLWFVKKQNAKLEAMREALIVNLQNEGSVRSTTPKQEW